MRIFNGNLGAVGRWHGRNVMGYIEFLEIGSRRFRKIACPPDLFDAFNHMEHEGVSLFTHNFLFLRKLIIGVKPQEGKGLAMHYSSLLLTASRTFFIIEIVTLALLFPGGIVDGLHLRNTWTMTEIFKASFLIPSILTLRLFIEYTRMYFAISRA